MTASDKFANQVTRITVSIAAFAMVLIWGATGSVFHYSETWQAVINNGITIITFLMVFLTKA